MLHRSHRVAATLLTWAAVAGCSPGTDPSSPRPATPDPDQGKSFTVMVGAAGGVVNGASGRAILTVPPQALDSDVPITLKVEPPASELLTSTYVFDPDGLQFATPATLSIAFDGNPAAGKRVVLAMRRAGEPWQPLADSRLIQGRLTASVEHFSSAGAIPIEAVRCFGDSSGSGTSGGGPGTSGGSGDGPDDGPGSADGAPAPASICDMDDSPCSDGVERDFECSAQSCKCEQNDQIVKTVANRGFCKGGESDREIAELSNGACGWNIVLVPRESSEGRDEPGGPSPQPPTADTSP